MTRIILFSILLVPCNWMAGIANSMSQEDILVALNPDTDDDRSGVIHYPSSFFDMYQPNTALDMVEQVPGFRIDNGGEGRGFGGTSGNVLIDGRRPTAKQDQPSNILDRIPASKVDRIEMIRGAVRDVELQGQVEVVNVILSDDSPASIRWETRVGKSPVFDTVPLNGNISIADTWQAVDYNLGFEVTRFARADEGTESRFNASRKRTDATADNNLRKGIRLISNLNGTTLLMDTDIHFNAKIGYQNADEDFISTSIFPAPTAMTPTALEVENEDELEVELGFDFERQLLSDLAGKFILLYVQGDQNTMDSKQQFMDTGELFRTRLKDTDTFESEAILRSEFVWTGWPGHSPQLSMEAAYNVLENAEIETSDTGKGPIDISVPGANTRVEEIRGDILLHETWANTSLEFDYGLGAEVSRIKQTGDENLARNFFFLKPYSMLSYSPDESRQTRLQIERKVSQLDFDDFVSSTVFEDDDVALGNPNLRPETTWVGQLSYEQRNEELGVYKLTAFHHWITDVQDLLPLSDTNEAAGNIGNGRRWGIMFESSMPLEKLGLNNSRLDFDLYWQDSKVTDPVTGESRKLSSVDGGYFNRRSFGSDVEYEARVDFRQDLDAQEMAWGWDISFNAERTSYNVNELDTRDDRVMFNMYTETTRWFGLKFRLDVRNLIDSIETRNRVIYSGLRGLTPIETEEVTAYTGGRRFILSVNGSF